jgi:hypothetical protein
LLDGALNCSPTLVIDGIQRVLTVSPEAERVVQPHSIFPGFRSSPSLGRRRHLMA